jgi:hypothetical protein
MEHVRSEQRRSVTIHTASVLLGSGDCQTAEKKNIAKLRRFSESAEATFVPSAPQKAKRLIGREKAVSSNWSGLTPVALERSRTHAAFWASLWCQYNTRIK